MTGTLIQRLRRHRGDYVEEMDEAADALEQQAAQIEALRADAERWRHVQHGFAAQSVAIDGMHSWTWRGYHMIGKGANIDEAVDAALRREASNG